MNERSTLALAALFAVSAPDVLAYGDLKGRFREAVAKDPIDATLATIAVASYLFYYAERGHNPKVTTVGDAFVFITTCLSVGYSDIFARTEIGKAIASAIMTVGPAMTEGLLKPPRDARDETLEAQRAIVARLDAILDELKARG